jgi:ferritin-like protein
MPVTDSACQRNGFEAVVRKIIKAEQDAIMFKLLAQKAHGRDPITYNWLSTLTEEVNTRMNSRCC